MIYFYKSIINFLNNPDYKKLMQHIFYNSIITFLNNNLTNGDCAYCADIGEYILYQNNKYMTIHFGLTDTTKLINPTVIEIIKGLKSIDSIEFNNLIKLTR